MRKGSYSTDLLQKRGCEYKFYTEVRIICQEGSPNPFSFNPMSLNSTT